jgi:hypothetical protein
VREREREGEGGVWKNNTKQNDFMVKDI